MLALVMEPVGAQRVLEELVWPPLVWLQGLLAKLLELGLAPLVDPQWDVVWEVQLRGEVVGRSGCRRS